jgi:hypothetical protein
MSEEHAKITQARELLALSETAQKLDLVVTIAILLTGLTFVLVLSYWLGHRENSMLWPLVSFLSSVVSFVAKIRIQALIERIEAERGKLVRESSRDEDK